MANKLAALLKKIGPSPDRIISPRLVTDLAKLADPTTVPWLLGIMTASSSAVEQALGGLRAIGDPAAIPGIRAWIATKNDQPHLRNLAVAKEVIEYLAKRGPIPKSVAALPAKKSKPGRPTLVYRKAAKVPKRRAPGTLATQWAAIEASFTEAGLPARRAKDVATEGVLLWTTRVDEQELAVGATKIGGHPDLPAAAKWPRHAKRPMAFVAQIELASISKILDSELPSRGLLSFFVVDDPDDEYLEKCAVIHSDGKLTRTEVPEDYTGTIYQACKVSPHAVVKLPGRESAVMYKALGKQAEVYADEVFRYTAPEHQLLGARDHDIDGETRVGERLLLQIKSDDQAAFSWGDADVLSFIISRAALSNHDFRKVRICLTDE